MGRTVNVKHDTKTEGYFNSLAPCGANPLRSSLALRPLPFQLTRPVWGEPCCDCSRLRYNSHFNSLAPCGANLAERLRCRLVLQISTHSPRVGRTAFARLSIAFLKISTHSPRVGRTLALCARAPLFGHFNSLAPCGANPTSPPSSAQTSAFQLTRPVWGEPRI